MTTWTQELADAIEGLVAEPVTNELDQSIRSRAIEYRSVRPGYVLKPHQLEYTECLIQRLDYMRPRASHTAFRTAWEKALEARHA